MVYWHYHCYEILKNYPSFKKLMCALCLSKLKYSYVHIWLHIKLIKICPFPSRQIQDQNKYFRCQLFSVSQLVYGWAPSIDGHHRPVSMVTPPSSAHTAL